MQIALQIAGFLLATIGFGVAFLSIGTGIYNAGYAWSLREGFKKLLIFCIPAGIGVGIMFFGIWLML